MVSLSLSFESLGWIACLVGNREITFLEVLSVSLRNKQQTQIKFKSLSLILKNDIKYIETDKSWTFVYEIGHCRYIHWSNVLRTRGRRVMTFVPSGFLGLAMNLDNSTIYQSDHIHTEAPTIFYLTPTIQKFIIIIRKWSNIVMSIRNMC